MLVFIVIKKLSTNAGMSLAFIGLETLFNGNPLPYFLVPVIRKYLACYLVFIQNAIMNNKFCQAVR